MTISARRSPLPAGGPHAAQGDRRRGVPGGIAAAHRTRPVRTVRRSAGTPSARRCAGCATTISSRRGRARAPLVVPRIASNSYAQDNMSINDLLAFASGAHFDIEATKMVTIDAELAERTGLPEGQEWLSVLGYRQAVGRRIHALLDRVLHQPRVRRRRQAAATAHRSDLPAHRGSLRRQRRRGLPGDRRRTRDTGTGRAPQGRGGLRRRRGAPHVQDLRRGDRTGHHQHPSRIALSALDDTAPGEG